MNKREKEQLRVSIARDLIQGQGGGSPTRELLKQYAPLQGVVTPISPEESSPSSPPEPVENSMAGGATVARNEESVWHGATVAGDATLAPRATVAGYAMVKGELRVPNTINFSVFPTLDPFAKAVYYQLFLLSHGFRRDTCLISLSKLARVVLMSQRKIQDTIAYLEKRRLIEKLESKLGGESRGTLYRVPLPVACIAPDATRAQDATLASGATQAPHATLAPHATVAPRADNKEKFDDDDRKENHHQRSEKPTSNSGPVENHSRAAAPREKAESAAKHLALVRAGYEKATGNRWNKSDTEAYAENGLQGIPAEKIISVLETVAQRTSVKVNSLAYFIREILALQMPRNRAWQKKRLRDIVHRIRDNSVGRVDYSTSDFIEDVKCACARDSVPFDNDVFNELTNSNRPPLDRTA
jgi:hypothetical protein